MKTVIVVHGGAWAIPDMLAEASVAGVKKAARAGDAVLKNGGSAIDAVEKAVRALEDDPAFDAGHGAVLNIDGEVELDSIIMDGETLATGAVASVRNIANPVSLARAVMEKTDHVMLTDRGASMFAERIGIPVADDLVTELERKDWEQSGTYPAGVKNFFNTQWGHDTVGAVALDSLGNVACATSTGGIRNKMVGRVGDSPIIGKSASAAAEASLQYMGERVKGCGGAIVVTSTGDWAARFTTTRMAWASVQEDVLHHGLNPKEDFTEMLKQ
ncbi:isoaspartyl peptidase/L-asparaginase isoform X2 [Puntigrus tetrazona]|uniref:isoaspartyl peptidase/L-asparaginase isoform X2 n=1 Tax=Puntigrus tetrazona TaxID=1606681 RepID=UPI001C89A7DC|nr:isoaspartyl peptidase/L-asparaginase isoform X2 [Puntigrus tetrazona]